GARFIPMRRGIAEPLKGGAITLNVSQVNTTGAGPVILTASGSGLGDGGSVNVTLTKLAQNLTVGGGKGQFVIFAESGLDGGNGGKVSLTTSGNLVINPASLSAGPQGVNGGGESLSFAAMTGTVFFNGKIGLWGGGLNGFVLGVGG